MTLDPMHTSQQPAGVPDDVDHYAEQHDADGNPPEWNVYPLIEHGRASTRKRTRTLADRTAADLDRLAEMVGAEQRIALLEDQIRAEREKLTGGGRDDDRDDT